MPKRDRSFEPDLEPQIKTHVGQKEINNGVSKDVQMKIVYDRTMNLLLEGAKELTYKLKQDEANINPIVETPKKPMKQDSKHDYILKQTTLTNKLGLEKTNFDVKSATVDLCGCCRVIDNNQATKCFYCDQILCSSCLFQCSECSEMFCQNCYLKKYEGGELNVCISCYN